MDITDTQYTLSSSEYLGLIAKNRCLILFEKGTPRGKLKFDFISLTTRDGGAFVLNARGYRVSPVKLPREIFDDFLAASLIEQVGEEDSEGRISFRLTPDGETRGTVTT